MDPRYHSDCAESREAWEVAGLLLTVQADQDSPGLHVAVPPAAPSLLVLDVTPPGAPGGTSFPSSLPAVHSAHPTTWCATCWGVSPVKPPLSASTWPHTRRGKWSPSGKVARSTWTLLPGAVKTGWKCRVWPLLPAEEVLECPGGSLARMPRLSGAPGGLLWLHSPAVQLPSGSFLVTRSHFLLLRAGGRHSENCAPG